MNEPVAAKSPLSDSRFSQLQNAVRELKGMNRELNEVLGSKLRAIFGETPEPVEPKADTPMKPPSNGWLEQTLHEVEEATEACRSALEQVASV